MTPYEELELALTHLARAGDRIVALGQGPQGRYISAQAQSMAQWSRAQGLTDDVDDAGEPDEGVVPRPRDLPQGQFTEEQQE